MFSILISAATAGFSSGSLSYDWDCDPTRRRNNPKFYGYIPDGGGRTLIFVCMVLNSMSLLLIRASSAAFLMLVNIRFFLLYLAGDMLLYLLLKTARGDFSYWLPISGSVGLVVSLVIRVIAKTICDFTGVIQLRAPAELGGIYWSANMVMAIAASLASIALYFDRVEDKDAVAPRRTVYACILILCGTWFISFSTILKTMKKEYVSTFFSFDTGNDWAQSFFIHGASDEAKSKTLGLNPVKWKSLRAEAKAWTLENFWRWIEEKPDWFTDNWIAKLPSDFIPEAVTRANYAAEHAHLHKMQAFLGSFASSGRRLSGIVRSSARASARISAREEDTRPTASSEDDAIDSDSD